MRIWLMIAGLNGLLAVAMGAIGAHAAAAPALVERASLYQLIHAAGMLAIAGQGGRMAGLARLAWLGGIVLFCGSLYMKALFGLSSALAPAGGLLLMLGWLLVAVGGMRRGR